MVTSVKVTNVGGSFAIILPKELLDKLKVTEGSTVQVSEVSDGVLLSASRATFEEKMKVAEEIMDENHDVLRRLAE
ncbi:SpoVT/AbrB-like protein [Candidatus Koribacter versatilis Ellin345]|uniref:SpoVT/AbrB-like protein n=1 Tax=Koribacter versatilis (strain Ellin345) TaxID=204669 RepID=Q1IJ41_KORVE|nr:AbrB/MazE/SpoVT family DNA-binding domain-containing protein [Candidatus Koribacter versatilis]ABF43109.1 SpoVT/AbrB-like protein [Candidatus Koribacter versatilis Ellin345]